MNEEIIISWRYWWYWKIIVVLAYKKENSNLFNFRIFIIEFFSNKDYYSNYGFMFDKKKRKWFEIRTNKDSSIRNKSKVKKINYLDKKKWC